MEKIRETLREIRETPDDPDVARRLFGELQGMVQRTMLAHIARRGLPSHLLEDAFVEFFMKALRLAQRGRIDIEAADATLLAFLKRLTRNAISDAAALERAHRRLLQKLRVDIASDSAAAAAEDQARGSASRDDVSEALGLLRRDDRRLVELVYFEGRTQRDAGAALGLKPDAARKRLQRALADMSAFLGRER